MRSVSFAAVLAGFWLALSGHFTGMLLGLGAASVGLVVVLARRADVVDAEGHPSQLSTRTFSYWLWLAIEVLKSALRVIVLVLRGGEQPAVRRVSMGDLSPVGKATLANSITLTPGTLSMCVIDDQIEVHSLHAPFLDDLDNGSFQKRVQRFDSGAKGQSDA